MSRKRNVAINVLFLLLHTSQCNKKRTTSTTTEPTTEETTTESTTEETRTIPFVFKLQHRCDTLALFCMRAYKTGRVCARTIYYNYNTFKNYCMLDFVNCMEMFEVWQIVYMGGCHTYVPTEENLWYNFYSDSFLDDYYVKEDTDTDFPTTMATYIDELEGLNLTTSTKKRRGK